MSSSLEYWDKRWSSAPEKFATSWPDKYARALELEFIKTQLPPARRQIVEIGCGNLQLLEDSELEALLATRDYVGVDGSPPALAVAQKRAQGVLPRAAFSRHDLTQGPPALVGDMILSKRTLQNLTYDSRQDLWPWIGQFEHGCLIEDYRPARDNLDAQRAQFGRPPLLVPDFNYPITEGELACLDALVGDVRAVAFMGLFYSITRVYPKLAEAGHAAAFEQSVRAIRRGQDQPVFGPVVALVW